MNTYMASIETMTPFWEEIKSALEQAHAKAVALQHVILVSCSMNTPPINPLLYLTSARNTYEEGCFWSPPGHLHKLTGVGSAWRYEQEGGNSDALSSLWQEVVDHSLIIGEHQPMLFGGLRFDSQAERTDLWQGFEDTSFILHRFLFEQKAGQGQITINMMLEATDEPVQVFKQLEREWYQLHQVVDQVPAIENFLSAAPPASHWTQKISDAISEIDQGKIDKVVMARSHTIPVKRYAGDVLRELCEQNPNAYVFGFFRQGRCFMGASPEKLVALQDKVLSTMALAGSAPRHENPVLDEALSEQLLASVKDVSEHRYVVERIRQVLQEYCVEMDIAELPEIVKLPHVQHLHTPIQATIADRTCVLELVRAFHPTPAVGGLPVDHAVQYIRESEELDRGWYAAPVGYLDAKGEGLFIVALRSALLDRHAATLFAGCGIVKNSDPMQEWFESQIKMKTMASAIALSSLGADVLLEQ